MSYTFEKNEIFYIVTQASKQYRKGFDEAMSIVGKGNASIECLICNILAYIKDSLKGSDENSSIILEKVSFLMIDYANEKIRFDIKKDFRTINSENEIDPNSVYAFKKKALKNRNLFDQTLCEIEIYISNDENSDIFDGLLEYAQKALAHIDIFIQIYTQILLDRVKPSILKV